MGMLLDGEWHEDAEDLTNEDGAFVRDTTSFRNWIGDKYPAEAGRYHLYISRACPWAHRTAITRRLRGLDDAVSLSLVEPVRRNDGWEFSDRYPDPHHDARYLRELYQSADPGYTGRVTVPVLWDREEETIVNNESREIMRMLDTRMEDLANDSTLLPHGMEDRVDEIIDEIYQPINNGVYRAGFAESQEAYEEAVRELFTALDDWEEVLGSQRFLAGDQLTEADVCMFPTLVRFDHVYHTTPTTLPKVRENVTDGLEDRWKRIVDYPNLYAYMRDIYQTDDVAETVNFQHIVDHYGSPGSPPGFDPRDVPPEELGLDLEAPHGRNAIAEHGK